MAMNELITVSDDVCTEFAYTLQISSTFWRVIFCGLANNGTYRIGREIEWKANLSAHIAHTENRIAHT